MNYRLDLKTLGSLHAEGGAKAEVTRNGSGITIKIHDKSSPFKLKLRIDLSEKETDALSEALQ